MRWFLFYSYWVLYELHEREDWLALILLLRGPCRGVTKLDGAWARSKFGAPVSKTEVFCKHMFYVLKKVLVTLLRFFGGPQPLGAPCTDWRPHSGSAPGNGCPCCPNRYVPGAVTCRFQRYCSYIRKTQVNFLMSKWLHDPRHRIQIQ